MATATVAPGKRRLTQWARDARARLLLAFGSQRCRRPPSAVRIGLGPAAVFGDRHHHTFFGYYDVTPFSPGDRRLLACRVRRGARPESDTMEIGCYDLEDAHARFHRLDHTDTWCWQQGCRLQWLPGSDGRQVLFNTMVHGKYGAVVLEVDGAHRCLEIPHPVYALHPTAAIALSLNFDRLQVMRPGYGYGPRPGRGHMVGAPEGDGVVRIDLASGESRLLASFARLAGYRPHATMEGAVHYLNHLSWNPSASRLLLMHLWVAVDGCRHNRLITMDGDGKDWWPLVDSGKVSHHCWLDDRHVLAYAWHPEDDTYRYRLYRDGAAGHDTVPLSAVEQDGHPSYSPDRSWIVSDTYPEICRRQFLLLLRVADGTILELADLHSPARFDGEFRCDLHPRWSALGKRIAVDTTRAGYRQMAVFDVSAIIGR